MTIGTVNYSRREKYSVLIVDDCVDDRFFWRRALKRFRRFAVVGELADGEDAIDYLSGAEPFDDRREFPLPDLLLLDLRMPKKSGFDVLQWLRESDLSELTVAVVSGTESAEDMVASFGLGAHGIWNKAATTEEQDLILREIEELLDQRFCGAEFSEQPVNNYHSA